MKKLVFPGLITAALLMIFSSAVSAEDTKPTLIGWETSYYTWTSDSIVTKATAMSRSWSNITCDVIEARVSIYDADGTYLAGDTATKYNATVAETKDVVNPTWSQAGDIAKGYHYWDPQNSTYSPVSQTSSDTW